MAMTCHRIYSTGYNTWINKTLKGDILSTPKGLVMGTSEGAASFGTSKGAFYRASEIASFGVSKGDILCSGKNYDLHKKHCFTTSFADVDLEQLNTQVHFDTDSVFFVCDNSTTGHICNDIKKFVPGSLWQTNKSLTTANGTGACLQKGTVWKRLIDDAGTQHIFILDNCLYHPDSPVNLLSIRHLAEKFIDANGNPDKET
jgi:hypothetical protein